MGNLARFEFNGFEFRVIQRDGEPWFVAADVCHPEALSLTNVSMALKHLDEDEKATEPVSNVEGLRTVTRDVLVISESGLYKLIMRSRKEKGREFANWVTREVLPTIRKSGAYVSPGSDLASTLASGDTEATLALLEQAVEIAKDERTKRLEAEPRTLSAMGAEKRTGGETVWNLRDALADHLGVDTRQVYPALRLIGVVEKRSSGGHLVKKAWSDLLFDTETEVGGGVYKTGAPRVRPGKQSEFMTRVREEYRRTLL